MVTFVVMNTACLQLIPSTIAALRRSAGSAAPFDIMPAIWVTSVCAWLTGLSVVFLLRRRRARPC